MLLVPSIYINKRSSLSLPFVLIAIVIFLSLAFTVEAYAKDNKVTIAIVYDNLEASDSGLRLDWGFGCVVDAGHKRILFDTGEEGSTLLSNMNHLNIEPSSIDAVAISHIHSDHSGGLKTFLSKRKGINVYIPASFPDSFKQMVNNSGSNAIEVSGPAEIIKGVFTTGEMGASIKEQALIVSTDKGLVVVTGCAHPGIVEVVKKAKEVGKAKPYAVIGGFHTASVSQARLNKIVEAFKELEVKKVAPCHCSGRTARKLFEKEFGAGYIDAKVGSIINIP